MTIEDALRLVEKWENSGLLDGIREKINSHTALIDNKIPSSFEIDSIPVPLKYDSKKRKLPFN